MIVTKPLPVSHVAANVPTVVLTIACTLAFALSRDLVIVDPARIVTSVVPNFAVSVVWFIAKMLEHTGVAKITVSVSALVKIIVSVSVQPTVFAPIILDVANLAALVPIEVSCSWRETSLGMELGVERTMQLHIFVLAVKWEQASPEQTMCLT